MPTARNVTPAAAAVTVAPSTTVGVNDLALEAAAPTVTASGTITVDLGIAPTGPTVTVAPSTTLGVNDLAMAPAATTVAAAPGTVTVDTTSTAATLAGFQLEVAFGDPPHAAATWVDVTADVVSCVANTCRRTSEFDAFSAGTATVILDDSAGNYDPTNGSSPYTGQFVWGTPLRVRARSSTTWHTVWRGYCTLFTPAPNSGAPRTRIQAYDGFGLLADWQLAEVAATGLADTVTDRIGAELDLANWPAGNRDLQGSSSVMSATTRGRTALKALQADALAEGGLVYHRPQDDTIVFDVRNAIQTRTRQATVQRQFGGAGELPVDDGSLTIAGTGNTYRNIVRVTDAAGVTSTAGSVAANEAEKAVTRTVELAGGDDADILARYWLDLYDTEYPAPVAWSTTTRIGVTDVAADAYTVQLRDRVNVEWVRPVAGGTENYDVLVTGLAYRFTPSTSTVGFVAEPADAYDNLAGAGTWLAVGVGVVDTATVGY